MKILVLEDNERLANVIKSVLIKEGYQVDLFMDGEKALDALNHGYHCFILDINVPSIDGLSILETIRIYHKEIPAIIISSNHDLEKIQASYEIGCHGSKEESDNSYQQDGDDGEEEIALHHAKPEEEEGDEDGYN
jgi:DNA-binding response OmpR family regulator